MLVRAAVAEDLEAVVRLERGIATAPHWAQAEYRAICCGGVALVRRCLLLAEWDEKIVGFAVGKVLGDEGELESVAVDQDLRRMGVGRALCEAILQWCRGVGAQAIELEVRSGSLGAIQLYEGLGFREMGRRRGYYREPVEDAVLMRCELADGNEL